MADYYVRLVALPMSVEGVVLPNDDGSFDIYINSLLSDARRRSVLAHELRHIEREHFFLDLPISLVERQADGENVNVVLHPPAGKLPCFRSEAAFLNWLRVAAVQQHINLPLD